MTVLSESSPHIYPSGAKRRKWLCVCECGNTINVLDNNLKSGDTKSCGCHQIECSTKHGLCDHPLYQIWISMINRCHNPNNKDYSSYGGRGIYVCDVWRNDINKFIEDVGDRPDGYQLDRINNDGGYHKDNVRWISSKENNRNRRSNKLISHDDKTMTMIEWSEHLNMDYQKLKILINQGYALDEIINLLRSSYILL